MLSAEPKILIHAIKMNELARVLFPVRVKNLFALGERLDQFRSEQFRKEFRFRLTVAMFS